MQPDELLADIAFAALKPGERGMFIKLALRRAQAISVVDAAVIVDFDHTNGARLNRSPSRALGSPWARWRPPSCARPRPRPSWPAMADPETIARAAELAAGAARPIDDVRGPAEYRRDMVAVVTGRRCAGIVAGQARGRLPEAPVMLWGPRAGRSVGLAAPVEHDEAEPIVTRINHQDYVLRGGNDKTLLRLLREDAHLIGTKEGCAEGECGACTVFLDGAAVMSCMVPAPRRTAPRLSPWKAWPRPASCIPSSRPLWTKAPVQCGYCTPGFLMAGAKLLEERPRPAPGRCSRRSPATCAAAPVTTRSWPRLRRLGASRAEFKIGGDTMSRVPQAFRESTLKKKEINPIWRGIGFILIILLTVGAFWLAGYVLELNWKTPFLPFHAERLHGDHRQVAANPAGQAAGPNRRRAADRRAGLCGDGGDLRHPQPPPARADRRQAAARPAAGANALSAGVGAHARPGGADMDRNVPRTGSEEIELYVRTYYSLLRSSEDVQIKTLVEAHAQMESLLHPHARDEAPDMSAFLYSVLRLPECMGPVHLVILGQSREVFARHGVALDGGWDQRAQPRPAPAGAVQWPGHAGGLHRQPLRH